MEAGTDRAASGQLTVVLATHNGALWLPELLESLARQTLTPARLCILDDASTDGTWELVRDALIPEGQVVASRQEVNEGAIRTFERLLSTVDTEFFALCDQDDVWMPDKLEKSVSLLDSSGADLVYTDLQVVDGDLRKLAPSMWRHRNAVPVMGRALIPLLLKNSVTGCTVLGRTSMLKKALPFPADIPMHDWWLGLVAASGNGVAPLLQPTVLYRQHSRNEVGAAPFGYRGLRSRLGRREASLGSYLDERLAARLLLIDSLQELGLMGGHAFLAWFYRRAPLVRFLLGPAYLFYTATHAGVLGFRNLVVDWTLTCTQVRGFHRKALS
jgi:glycosyltransferase involved in cell wall biosynthesis